MHQAQIAAFLNQKGGVGKTTSVVNIGAGLSLLGKKVLIVDLDPQGHLTTFLGIESVRFATTVYDVVCGKGDARTSIVRQELGARLTVDGNHTSLTMSVLPSNVDLAKAEAILALRHNREFLLKEALDRIRGDFDYILIDCPPSLGLLSSNALVAADRVFIPVQAEFLALESLENLLGLVESIMAQHNPDLEIGGLIATRYDSRKVINRSVVESLQERFGVLLLGTRIRENIVLAESPSVGKDIFTYRPRSHGAQDYLNLCLEIVGQGIRSEELFTVERGGAITRHAEARVAS